MGIGIVLCICHTLIIFNQSIGQIGKFLMSLLIILIPHHTLTVGEVEVATPLPAATAADAAAAATCSHCAAATTAICCMRPDAAALEGSEIRGSTKVFSVDEGRESSFFTSIFGGIMAITSLLRLSLC